MQQQAVYNQIAQEYKESKQLPFRKYIETYSLFELTRHARYENVLDLACGEGFFTRKLKARIADNILGVDISSEMIGLAEANELQNPIGCNFVVHDAAELPATRSFDLVVAMYLLNYARSYEELSTFCKSAYNQLKPGTRFIGFNDNVSSNPANYESYRKYGFIKETPAHRIEGDPIRYTFFNQDGTVFQFNNYYLRPDTYAKAFAEAGFEDFKWTGVQLDPSQQGNEYWDDFLSDPPVVGFEAYKR